MKFSIITALAAASFVSASNEDITISDFTLHKAQEGGHAALKDVKFTLAGEAGAKVKCDDPKGDWPRPAVVTCGESKYRYGINTSKAGGPDAYTLYVYHDLGTAFGRYGSVDFTPTCKPGQDSDCTVKDIKLTINSA